MDIIQRTVSLFSALVKRIREIGDLLISNYMPTVDEVKEFGDIFWIFNW